MGSISSLIKKNKVDNYLVFIIIILLIGYLVGLFSSSEIDRIHKFGSRTIADTAQVARNTIRGELFVTKYILPVGYMFNPIIKGHPDFIRYPFQILLYSLLFMIFSPDPAAIKLFSGFIYIFNGILMYLLFKKIGEIESAESGTSAKKEYRLLAFLTSLFTSLFVTQYFCGIFNGLQEITAYCIVILFILTIVAQPLKPVIIGILGGLIYLSRPNMVLIVPIFLTAYLFTQYKQKRLWKTLLFCIIGTLAIITPFLLRSYYYTGEITFSLQHKVDLIKGVKDYYHSGLYKSFSIPPSAFSVILEYKRLYLERWMKAVSDALTVVFHKDYWFAWLGFLPFLCFNKKSSWLLYCYFLFFIAHIIIASNYLFFMEDSKRIYIPIMTLFTALGFWGLFSMIKNIIHYLGTNYRVIIHSGLSILGILIIIQYSNNLTLLTPKAANQTLSHQIQSSINTIKSMNIPCLYSNDPYWTSWNLDIPSIYKTEDPYEMITKGPRECEYFLWYTPQKADKDIISEFLSQNAAPIYTSNPIIKLYGLRNFEK